MLDRDPSLYDVIIVGGGPAGLSAALILARCCRKILVCDSGHPRNARSEKLHGFLTREDISPVEYLTLARKELAQYPAVEILNTTVTFIQNQQSHFLVHLAGAATRASRKILLATGVIDELPPLAG